MHIAIPTTRMRWMMVVIYCFQQLIAYNADDWFFGPWLRTSLPLYNDHQKDLEKWSVELRRTRLVMIIRSNNIASSASMRKTGKERKLCNELLNPHSTSSSVRLYSFLILRKFSRGLQLLLWIKFRLYSYNVVSVTIVFGPGNQASNNLAGNNECNPP